MEHEKHLKAVDKLRKAYQDTCLRVEKLNVKIPSEIAPPPGFTSVSQGMLCHQFKNNELTIMSCLRIGRDSKLWLRVAISRFDEMRPSVEDLMLVSKLWIDASSDRLEVQTSADSKTIYLWHCFESEPQVKYIF